MEFLNNIHTYLAMSFLFMLFVVFKKFYETIGRALDGRGRVIRRAIDSVEKRKNVAEEEIEQLTKTIEDVEEAAEKIVLDAEKESTKIIDIAEEKIKVATALKEKEYQATILKIKNKLLLELQNKIIYLSVKLSARKIAELKNNRSLLNKDIDNSTAMLEKLAEVYDASKIDVLAFGNCDGKK